VGPPLSLALQSQREMINFEMERPFPAVLSKSKERRVINSIRSSSAPAQMAWQAAITLAQAGYPVRVLEADATIGGGTRSAGLTLPGFLHDVCSAIHPLAAGSPFFQALPLDRFGLAWVESEIVLARTPLRPA